MSPSRIANSIMQDSTFKGSCLLVEGESDIKLFGKFSCKENSRIKVSFGKKEMRDIYNILQQRDFNRVVGIRDADFIRINNKFDENYGPNIFITDYHDSEGMIINSSAFDNFLLEACREINIIAFQKKFGDVRDYLYQLNYSIACLRLANKKYNLGLAFKPVRPEGNKVKFKKFICEKTMTYLGHDKLINTIVEYSKNRGSVIAEREEILDKLLEVINEKYPQNEVSNGHDLAEVLFIICKKGLKSSNKLLQDASSVEGMLRLAYGRDHFAATSLLSSFKKLESKTCIHIFNPAEAVA